MLEISADFGSMASSTLPVAVAGSTAALALFLGLVDTYGAVACFAVTVVLYVFASLWWRFSSKVR